MGFLQKNNYPRKLIWVEPDDVLLSGRHLIYIRLPIPSANELRVRQLFDLSQNRRIGIHFRAICAIDDTTYAFAWVPQSASEAQNHLMGDGLKMSVNIDLGKVEGQVVTSGFRWRYLRMILRGHQKNKLAMFS